MKSLTRVMRLLVVVCFFVLALAPAVMRAQCVASPTRETALAMMNASNYFLAFYVDGVYMGRVAPGERSMEFIVGAGEHLLLAKTMTGGEPVSATRVIIIPAGSVCTWTVTNPMNPPEGRTKFRDRLAREAFVSLAVPN
jgi:hypothetical protein